MENQTIENQTDKDLVDKIFVSKDEAMLAFICLLEGLSFEVCSPAPWIFAMSSAKDQAINKYGMSEKAFDEVMNKFKLLKEAKKKTNPIHGMF